MLNKYFSCFHTVIVKSTYLPEFRTIKRYHCRVVPLSFYFYLEKMYTALYSGLQEAQTFQFLTVGIALKVSE